MVEGRDGNDNDSHDDGGVGVFCDIRMKIADVSFYWFHGQD